jgi:hypothetical protein
MSFPLTVVSVINAAVLKALPDIESGKQISIDAVLKAAGLELYKDEEGNVAQRAKKAVKAVKADKGIAKAEASAASALPAVPAVSALPAVPATPLAIMPAADETALLMPVDASANAPVPVIAPASANKPYPDAFSSHASRLQVLDLVRCMGRRLDEDSPLNGTRKGDPGANGKFFPERQCTKKPKEGKLCATCAKLDGEAKAEPGKAIKRWHGRLDEPMYANAFVVGSAHFFEKYPTGIDGDSSSAPVKASVQVSVQEPAQTSETAVSAPAKKPKKVVQKKKKDATAPANASAPVAAEGVAEGATEGAVEESVAVETDAKECVWQTFFHNGVVLIRHLKNGNVYRANTDADDHEEMVMKDKFEGRWEDGALNYGAEEVEDE